MQVKILPHTILAALIAVGLSTHAMGQSSDSDDELDWAERMFSELRYDFGNIARGSDARHVIEVENPYQETVRITNVGTTCGCTAAEPDVRQLATHEVARIEVQMNTIKFMRRKDSNVDVTLTYAGGSPRTVRIPITAYIRPDVVLDPGTAQFGSVETGQGGERVVSVAYAGDLDWRITDVNSPCEYLTTNLVETSRGDGLVKYSLTVTLLPEAPQGSLHERILLSTNDPRSPQVPVVVEGAVVPDIVVNPAVLAMGTLRPGVDKTMSVVVRGRRSFSIDKIECESDRDCFKVRLNSQVRSVHVLPLTVTPPDEPGELKELFYLTISGRDEPVTFTAEGIVVGQATAAR
jgi:hypothetical protein